MKFDKRFIVATASFLTLLCAIIAQAAPQAPKPTTDKKVPNSKLPNAATAADLAIEQTNQTSPDFFIVRIKNLGGTNSAATTLKLVVTTPLPKAGFPSQGILPQSYPVPAVKAGGVADINCKLPSKSSVGQRFQFTVNPDKAAPETNYNNNSKAVLANPSYK